jgi:hypothetical protein
MVIFHRYVNVYQRVFAPFSSIFPSSHPPTSAFPKKIPGGEPLAHQPFLRHPLGDGTSGTADLKATQLKNRRIGGNEDV